MLKLDCPPGTWQPPTYPALDSKSWRSSFLKADDARRTDIANMWCWRFDVEHNASNHGERLKAVAKATTWLRMIKPYVTIDQKAASPFQVMSTFLASPINRVPKKNLKQLKEQMDVLCFGEPVERVKAIKKVGTALGIFTQKRPMIATLLYLAAQNAAWDALNNAEYTEEDLLTTLKLGVHALTCEDTCDARGKAWVWFSNINQKIPRKDVRPLFEALTEIPETVLAEALLYLCRHSGRVSLSSDGYVHTSTQLVAESVRKPHLYDVLAHFIPGRAGWWQAAHAMGLTVDEAVGQIKNPQQYVLACEVPTNFHTTGL